MEINHLAIYANDMDKMCCFYTEKLALKEIERLYHDNHQLKYIKLEISQNQTLELMNFNKQMLQPKEKYVNWGFMHVGFTVEDINEIKKIFIAKNILIVQDIYKGNDELYHLFIYDPEKNLIEFTEVKKESKDENSESNNCSGI